MATPYNSHLRNWDAAFARSVLNATLASMKADKLLHSVWAARAIQNDRSSAGLRLMKNVPADAVTAELAAPLAIHPWELELLANERLSVPADALYLTQDPLSWEQMASLINIVRAIENEESVEFGDSRDIIDHLFRIASRQFEWQQGFLSKQEIFRSTFVYGTGASAEYFEEKFGLSLSNFSASCFAMLAVFFGHPQMRRKTDLSLIGVSDSDREIAVSMVSRPLNEMRRLAASQRNEHGEVAFKSSVLRTFPVIRIGACQSLLLCPLPDLLLNRMTSGLFYDIIDGGGEIRAEIGKKFETYVAMVLRELGTSLEFEEEYEYKTKNGKKMSPDILFCKRDEITHLIECKATRLSKRVRYGDFRPDERGYADMVKGVTQVWRFVADCRLGHSKRTLAGDVIGAVLTLDSWFVAAPKRQMSVISNAKELCARKHPEVETEDQIPIAFLYMPEFERALAQGDREAFFATFADLATDDKRGYSFDIALREDAPQGHQWKDFPFENRLAEILPWWSEFAERRENASSSS